MVPPRSQASIALSSHAELDGKRTVREYTRLDLQSCQFSNYHLTYAHYARYVAAKDFIPYLYACHADPSNLGPRKRLFY